MKLPISWLKEWVPVKAGAEEIAHRLTFAGLEVEGIASVEGEPVLEVNVTPNRGDCLSVRGLAREISAIYGILLKPPYKSLILKGAPKKPAVPVSIGSAKSCLRYALAVIEGVRVGPSPDWLVRRLIQTGLRPVNNVVDVTNFVLMELGHPLHAFDRSKIRGGRIQVRNARPGEVLKTLDGTERKLEAGDLVIADAEGPVAVAGVMGGANSEVGGETRSIALECAFFDPSAVRRVSRRLGLVSESAFRFERRVDPEGIPGALERAVSLILQTAGGELVSVTDITAVRKGKSSVSEVRFRAADVGAVLGGAWSEKEIRSSLTRLGFAVKPGAGGEWRVSVPSYRGDVSRPVDLIEEVARIRGLDRIPEKFPPLLAPVLSGTERGRETEMRTLLTAAGLRETIHYSFVSPELEGALSPGGAGAGGVVLANPLSREESVLRSSLLPSLLAAASLHARHKMETFRAFELRNVFAPGGGGRPLERKSLAGLLMGGRLLSHWSDGVRGTDFYDLKGVVENVLNGLGHSRGTVFGRSSAPYLHPGQQAEVQVYGKAVGVLGEVHPDVLGRFDLKKAVYVFELDWNALASKPAEGPKFKDFPRTPVVERDLALVVEEGVEAGRLLDFIRGKDPVISDARVFDLYRGGQIAPGKKSLAFSIRMGRPDRTLTEQEINDVFHGVIEGVQKQFGAEVR